MAINEWYWYFSASRDPYDTTERMQWEWKQANFDWTNGIVCGFFSVYLRKLFTLAKVVWRKRAGAVYNVTRVLLINA